MTRDDADFYVGTGPNARWRGSLATSASRSSWPRLGEAGDTETPAVLSVFR
ncbi:hypothetical protein [Amycolatopsis sp. lyj-23]|uniref:hypothetical protein n=1 Tax=Amycolatopsis sp. lyj-23 TaxID=2789283 RepID=UPI0039786AA3